MGRLPGRAEALPGAGALINQRTAAAGQNEDLPLIRSRSARQGSLSCTLLRLSWTGYFRINRPLIDIFNLNCFASNSEMISRNEGQNGFNVTVVDEWQIIRRGILHIFFF